MMVMEVLLEMMPRRRDQTSRTECRVKEEEVGLSLGSPSLAKGRPESKISNTAADHSRFRLV